MITTFTLYGPRKTLAYIAGPILDDENVESYEIHRDVDGLGYAFITLDDDREDLALETYEVIESAPGVRHEKEEEAA
jgi:hypothetical protein